MDQDSGGTNLASVTATGPTIRDNRWHRVLGFRQGPRVDIFIDGVLRGTASGVANLANRGVPTTIGVFRCIPESSIYYLNSHIAELAIYSNVESPPHRLCDISETWNYLNSTTSCNLISGFCSPAKGGRQCCAAEGCSECIGYHSCSRNFNGSSISIGTKTTATTLLTSIATMSASTVSTKSSDLFSTNVTPMSLVSMNGVSILTLVGVAIGSGLLCLLIGISIACLIQRKRDW